MAVKIREKPKSSGIWWVFINHLGVRKAKKIGRDKRLAREVAEKIEAKLILGDLKLELEEKEIPIFKEYAEAWLMGYIKGLKRESTFIRYRGVLKHYILPVLGNSPINEIRRGDVRNLLLRQLKKGNSRNTLGVTCNVLSGIMGQAVEDEIIQANPVSGITRKLQISRKERKEVEPFTPDEMNLFLETCAHRAPDFYPFFLCAFRTGMRLGELCGLQWGDIDWNAKYIMVQRSFNNGRVSPTKTGRHRRVDMSDQLSESLRSLLVDRKKEALKTGRGEVVEWIFHRNNEPIAQNSARNVFKRILGKAGLRHRRIHDIRHTYVSLLLSNGQSPVYVKEQVGHSSIQVTVDIYGHLIPSSNRDAVNALDNIAPTCNPYATTEKSKGVTV